MAGRYDIIIEQGATFVLPMTIKDWSCQPFNLTGWFGRGQVRKTHRSTTIVAHFAVTIVDALNGCLEAVLTDEQTRDIPTGETTTEQRSKYVYDIEIEKASTGEVKRLLEGYAYVSPEVTRS